VDQAPTRGKPNFRSTCLRKWRPPETRTKETTRRCRGTRIWPNRWLLGT